VTSTTDKLGKIELIEKMELIILRTDLTLRLTMIATKTNRFTLIN
jgi:hypothetical protein